jgi:hypothetical protein
VNRTLVSVVIPTYQRAHTLERAIDSALAQTYAPLEVIVSDNASTDGTMELLGRYRDDSRVRVIRHEANIGAVGNWASAVAAARGDLIKINWSDDWMDSHVVERLAAALAGDPTAGFAITGQTIHVGGSQRRVGIADGAIGLSQVVRSFVTGAHSLPVSPGAALLHREDVMWALDLPAAMLSASCRRRAIGPDLLMLYGSFRRTSHGVFVSGGGVHFEGGADSITMSEDNSMLRRCYLEALDVVLGELEADTERAALRQLEAARRSVARLRGRAVRPRMPHAELPRSANVRALPSTARWAASILGHKVNTKSRSEKKYGQESYPS